MVRFLHLRELGRHLVGEVLRQDPRSGGATEHDCPVHCRLPDSSPGRLLVRMAGDRVGRKYTFIVTLTGMGLATATIGLIPSFASIGLAAAFILFVLRMIRGLCLGGEYGGAITYVAEHVSDERRGASTPRPHRPPPPATTR